MLNAFKASARLTERRSSLVRGWSASIKYPQIFTRRWRALEVFLIQIKFNGCCSANLLDGHFSIILFMLHPFLSPRLFDFFAIVWWQTFCFMLCKQRSSKIGLCSCQWLKFIQSGITMRNIPIRIEKTLIVRIAFRIHIRMQIINTQAPHASWVLLRWKVVNVQWVNFLNMLYFVVKSFIVEINILRPQILAVEIIGYWFLLNDRPYSNITKKKTKENTITEC